MSEYIDPEFGAITIKRITNAKYIRLKISNAGKLSATMPRLAPLLMLRRLIDNSREQLRATIQKAPDTTATVYKDGAAVGASHSIRLKYTTRATAVVRGQMIIWNVPDGDDPESPNNQEVVRNAVRRALDDEAKAYLPRRLKYLAETYGFTYAKTGFGNAKGRWGSCTSHGVITLNVALMNLPMSLVDYVLIHELAHTKHLNHSPQFWAEVERCYPVYRSAKKQLKSFSPYL